MSMPLQQEIGQTERTLGALLAERVLEGGPFESITEWVMANILGTASLTPSELRSVAAAQSGDVDAALERMALAGIAVMAGGRVRLSESGRSALQAARIKTSYVASHIDEAIAPADRDAAVRVLATVRRIAAELRQSGIPAARVIEQ